MNAAVGLFSN